MFQQKYSVANIMDSGAGDGNLELHLMVICARLQEKGFGSGVHSLLESWPSIYLKSNS
jgi:hypothetical protein